MDKYIGFDIDSKKTVACVVQKGEKDRYTTFTTDILSNSSPSVTHHLGNPGLYNTTA